MNLLQQLTAKARITPKQSAALPPPATNTLTAQKTGLKSPAIGPLAPRDVPFIDGQRYSLAGSSDSTGLDLFSPDPNGPFVRRFGVLVAHHA